MNQNIEISEFFFNLQQNKDCSVINPKKEKTKGRVTYPITI